MREGRATHTRPGRLKWHRARRQSGDPAFSKHRIIEGLALGACVEIDLVVTGDDGFAVMHDLTLDKETEGRGPVSAVTASTLRGLRRRHADGTLHDETLLLLDDLMRALAETAIHPAARLQLDYKQDAAALTPGAIAGFASAVAPIAQNVILTTGDVVALQRLSAGISGLRVGYDPMETAAMAILEQSSDYARFVDMVVAAVPAAEMIGLHHSLILAAGDAGFDLAGAFRATGRWVDAYTIPGSGPSDVALTRRLVALGADQITADDPTGLVSAIGPEVWLAVTLEHSR